MPYGKLNQLQNSIIQPYIRGKVVYDLGAGDIGLSKQLLKLGAVKVIAIDKEYRFVKSDILEIEIRNNYFSDINETIDVAFVSWPANYECGLVKVLKRSTTIIYLGKNTDGSMCGTEAAVNIDISPIVVYNPSHSVSFRFLQAITNAVTNDRVTVGVWQRCNDITRICFNSQNITGPLRYNVDQALEAFKDQVSSNSFEIIEGEGSLLCWGQIHQGFTTNPENQFDELVTIAGLK